MVRKMVVFVRTCNEMLEIASKKEIERIVLSKLMYGNIPNATFIKISAIAVKNQMFM